MSEFKLNTPVAFIIFNRPDVTAQVFAEIAKAKPPKLLVIADGPRENKIGEDEKVAATREIINQVNWPCEVLTNFSDKNLGCKNRVASGLDWVFEQVEEAIILEDDCLPHPTFFRFCEEMLNKYRDDLRIGIVSGDNFQAGKVRNNDSYYFSNYVHIWGWATWKNRWRDIYDVDLALWPTIRDQNWLYDIFDSRSEAKIWESIFQRTYDGEINTWDYQWVFANLINNRLNIMPNINLVTNIGFARPDATHTTSDSKEANIPTKEVHFPLTHPVLMHRNKIADQYQYNQFIKSSTFSRLKTKILIFLAKIKRKLLSL